VETLAKRHEDDAGAWEIDGGNRALGRYHRDTAALLRALLDRAEKAEAERDSLWAQWTLGAP